MGVSQNCLGWKRSLRSSRCSSITWMQRGSPAADTFAHTAAQGRKDLDRNKRVVWHPRRAQHRHPQSQGWNAVRLVYYLPPQPLKDKLTATETHFSLKDSFVVPLPARFLEAVCADRGEQERGCCGVHRLHRVGAHTSIPSMLKGYSHARNTLCCWPQALSPHLETPGD